MDLEPQPFICPECGSRGNFGMACVSPDSRRMNDETDPWAGILEIHTCAQCKSQIPAHLSERWNNRTLEQAQKEWRERFRDSQPEE